MITQLFSQTDIVTNCLLYGTICLGAGLVAAWLFRRSAARAHQVLLLAMVAAVVVPAMSTLVGHYEIGILTVKTPPSQPYAAESTIMAELAMPITTELGAGEFQYELAPAELYSVPIVLTAAPPARIIPWRSILLALWLVTSVSLLARLIVTFVLGRGLLKKTVPVCGAIRQSAETAAEKLAVDKPIVVLVSEKIAGCVIWCWTRRPALLIPRSAEVEDKDTDWVALFSHELAHLQRLDHISGLFAELLVCIFPWQPLVWIGKKRLTALSEQACDDWAVSTADSHAGYARSLLDMVPQSKPGFVPTVLPNRRHLTARIQRILHSRRSNPRAGRGWALLAAVTAMFLAVTISFAQPRPADDREIDSPRRAEQREREEAEEGERLREREYAEVAERKIHARELQQRAKEIQLALKEHPDHPERAELRAALEEIGEQMHAIERELPGPGAEGRPVDGRPAEAHVEELIRHALELQARAKQIELELRELGDRNPDRSHHLREEMKNIANAAKAVERELQGVRRDREPGDPDARNRKIMQRRAELAERELLMRHREELHVRAEQVETELRELGDRNPDRSHQLRGEMKDITNAMETIERQLQAVRRDREPGDPDARNRKLMQRRAELIERAEMIERELKELGDAHPDESHKLRAQLEQIEEQLNRMNQMARSWPGAKDPGAGINKAHLRELMQERKELGERAGPIKRKLKEIGDSRPDEAHELRKQLEDISERMREIKAIERQVRRPEREQPGDREAHTRELMDRRRELEAHARETEILIERFENEDDKAAEQRTLEDIHRQMEEIDREVRGVERRGQGEGGDVGNEMDRLRGEVSELRNQMGEIRGMLERLLERERPPRSDRPRDEGEF